MQALREIEFDRETGKLSDSDYAALKSRYTREALAAMRDEDAGVAGPSGDAAEAVILQYRRRQLGCSACGPRPEPDAIYCSTCGRYLAGELRTLPRAHHRDRRALLRGVRGESRGVEMNGEGVGALEQPSTNQTDGTNRTDAH